MKTDLKNSHDKKMIEMLKNKLDHLLRSETNAKKAALILSLWINTPPKKK